MGDETNPAPTMAPTIYKCPVCGNTGPEAAECRGILPLADAPHAPTIMEPFDPTAVPPEPVGTPSPEAAAAWATAADASAAEVANLRSALAKSEARVADLEQSLK